MHNMIELNSPKLHHPACFEEVAGILHGLTEDEGILVADIGKIHLALPIGMKESLQPLIGQKITILRTDIPNKTYLFRVLSEEVE